MKLPVNLDIAITHIVTRQRQTLLTCLGITIGVSIYFFMNSLSSGFTSFSRDNIFQSNAHIKIFKEDQMSQPLVETPDGITLISNPQITTASKKLNNPRELLREVKAEPYITNALSLVEFSATYRRGNSQLQGSSLGVKMLDYADMFDTEDLMVGGSIADLEDNLNGIIIGVGISEKLNLSIGENITVSSTNGVYKVLRIVGIFSSGSASLDDSRSYVNISTAQQFLQEGPSYVTTLYANTIDPNNSFEYVAPLQRIVPYTVEDWTITNQDLLSTDATRNLMMSAITYAILIMAGFSIYNILSTTISQKIDDIAILKATGFNGSDVIRIIIYQALIMGVLGTLMGILVGIGLVQIMGSIYVGGPVGYFPISVELDLLLESMALGILVTLGAGYFPSLNAARVDPVEIFRK